MDSRRKFAVAALSILLGTCLGAVVVRAHEPKPGVTTQSAQASVAAATKAHPIPGITGQGKMRFRLLYTSEHLPDDAKKVLVKAHGGFAVDRRPGRGETYFALPVVGILQISADLHTIEVLNTAPEMKDVNLHDTTFWIGPDSTPYLVFPANDAGKVFTTTLDGKLVNVLNAPTGNEDFEAPEVRDYFLGGGTSRPRTWNTSTGSITSPLGIPSSTTC